MSARPQVEARSHGERPASESDAKKGRESVGRTLANSAHAAVEASGGDVRSGHWGAPVGCVSEDVFGLGTAAGGRAQRGPGGLPCLSKNNSTESEAEEIAVWLTRKESAKRRERQKAGRKLAFQAVGLVGDFAAHWGHGHVAMLTLTVEEQNVSPREFARRWNSFKTHEGGWINGFLRFLEPQQRGTPHYHVLVATGFDLAPNAFNWAAFNETRRQEGEPKAEFDRRRKSPEWRAACQAYARSAVPELRELWRHLRKVLPRYGFGRTELLPLRDKTGAAVYCGGYLRTGAQERYGAWKGARLIECDRVSSQMWRKHARGFQFNQTAERIWRFQLGKWATSVRCRDEEELRKRFGSNWCFRHRDEIMRIDAPDLIYVGVNQDGKALPAVNLRDYQEAGRISIAAAHAQANGWSQAESYSYLFQRGTRFDGFGLLNPAIREHVLATGPQVKRPTRAELCDVTTVWNGDDFGDVRIERHGATGT